MKLQKCTMEDVTKLALLNKQLIEDEKSENAMNKLGIIESIIMGHRHFKCY